MLKYVKGDIFHSFENEYDIMIQQSNCQGLSYFAGIASVISKKYPDTTPLHVEFCKNNFVFGDILPMQVKDKILVNFYSQYYSGSPSNTEIINDLYDDFKTRLKALKNCINKLVEWCYENKIENPKICIPLIASGIGADPELKGRMSDLDYFKTYIAPVFEEIDLDITVFYL